MPNSSLASDSASRDGRTIVAELASLMRRGIEPVFNLEVDADHCYRVGEQVLLVHHSSFGPIPAPSGASNCCLKVKTATTSDYELVNTAKQSNFILRELKIWGLSFIFERNLGSTWDGCFGRWMFE